MIRGRYTDHETMDNTYTPDHSVSRMLVHRMSDHFICLTRVQRSSQITNLHLGQLTQTFVTLSILKFLLP